jgi:hypothetical protein
VPSSDAIAGLGAGSSSVVALKNAPHLLNATRQTIQGRREHGGCTFTPPKLTLAPSQTAAQADEISIDTANCLSIWQIGTPTDLSQPSGANYASQRQTVAPTLLGPATLGSSSGYEMRG